MTGLWLPVLVLPVSVRRGLLLVCCRDGGGKCLWRADARNPVRQPLARRGFPGIGSKRRTGRGYRPACVAERSVASNDVMQPGSLARIDCSGSAVGGSVTELESFQQPIAFPDGIVAPGAERTIVAACRAIFNPAMPCQAALFGDAVNCEDGVHGRQRVVARGYIVTHRMSSLTLSRLGLDQRRRQVGHRDARADNFPAGHTETRHRRSCWIFSVDSLSILSTPTLFLASTVQTA